MSQSSIAEPKSLRLHRQLTLITHHYQQPRYLHRRRRDHQRRISADRSQQTKLLTPTSPPPTSQLRISQRLPATTVVNWVTTPVKKRDSVQLTPPTHSISAAVEEEESFYTTFGQLFDKEDDISKRCMASIITVDSNYVDKSTSIMVASVNQSDSTEAIFDVSSEYNNLRTRMKHFCLEINLTGPDMKSY